MIKVIKGNQIIIVVIAIMLVTVGYLNYSMDDTYYDNTVATVANETNEIGIGDAKLVSSYDVSNQYSFTEALVENENADTIAVNSEENVNKSNTDNENKNYFTNSRIEREAMYSKMLETYQKMLESENISQEQKAIATNEIKKITDIKNQIMIAENLIKTKDFEDVIIFVNNDSTDVVVKATKLETEDISKLQNIVSRELQVSIQNIHISNK